VNDLLGFPIRASAFLGKEIHEIVRQPRLMLTLILGPFLILLLFGIGFRNEAQPLRTLFVIADDSPLRAYLEEFANEITPSLQYAGTTNELADAQARLSRNEVDVVVAMPEEPMETILQSEQAVFVLYHDEIDPFQVEYVRVFGQVYVDEINRRLVADVAARGQEESSSVQDLVSAAHIAATALRQALEQGDSSAARTHRTELIRVIGLLGVAMASNTEFLAEIEENFGGEGGINSDLLETFSRVRESIGSLEPIESGQSDYSDEAQQVAAVEADLATLEEGLNTFNEISAPVLVSPFRSETRRINDVSVRLSDFYVPGSIALLIQHVAITFAALSIVREQNRGALELFRISPISSLETLLGKFISYFVFIGLLAVILTLLIVFVLKSPMQGNWLEYAAVMATLIFSALGVGFVLSLMAQTTSQAIQYSMILLLGSIFFSGFFLALQLLWEPIRAISWLLPVTYAIQMLQNVMLRGTFAGWTLLLILAAYGLVFFLIAWLLLRRRMGQQ
jgi:ABC-2 type transport system permease protein